MKVHGRQEPRHPVRGGDELHQGLQPISAQIGMG
jgi:hypothetical protein